MKLHRCSRDAHADRQKRGDRRRRMRHPEISDCLSYSLGNARSIGGLRQRKNHRELLASAARGQVQFAPAQSGQLCAQRHQALIASRVAFRIIEQLEVIGIDTQERCY